MTHNADDIKVSDLYIIKRADGSPPPDKSFYGYSKLLDELNVGDSFLCPHIERQGFYQSVRNKPISIKTESVGGDIIRVWRVA